MSLQTTIVDLLTAQAMPMTAAEIATHLGKPTPQIRAACRELACAGDLREIARPGDVIQYRAAAAPQTDTAPPALLPTDKPRRRNSNYIRVIPDAGTLANLLREASAMPLNQTRVGRAADPLPESLIEIVRVLRSKGHPWKTIMEWLRERGVSVSDKTLMLTLKESRKEPGNEPRSALREAA